MNQGYWSIIKIVLSLIMNLISLQFDSVIPLWLLNIDAEDFQESFKDGIKVGFTIVYAQLLYSLISLKISDCLSVFRT